MNILNVFTAASAAALTALSVAAPATADEPAGAYIVVLRAGASQTPDAAADQARALGGRVSFVYRHALRGFAATLPARAVERLRANGNVESVEVDQEVALGPVIPSAPVPTWGLDRIDQRVGLDNAYHYTSTGTGVTAYVLDTGIRTTHTDFGGRAVSGFDAIDGGTADDCHGHGTHVAGTIGGTRYGVAKNVTLVAVRVLSCVGTGSSSHILAGMDWVAADHDPGEPAVANMSLIALGGGFNLAIRNGVADGISYTVAAGNDTSNACSFSPASEPLAMTIGATEITDTEAYYSNFGACVDWYAPGSNIQSAGHTSDNATAVKSGTSMAAPHNAGVAAQFLQLNPSATPADVTAAISARLSRLAVVGPSAAFGNNHLLFTDF